MGTVQQSLFPHLDECLPVPLTEREKHLVKILELIRIEKHVPHTASRQWLGRPIKEREAIAQAFVAKAFLKYQHTSSLRNELRSAPNLRVICGFTRRRDVPSESTFSRAFAEHAKAGLGVAVHDALVKEDVNDCSLPLSAVLTSASVHDSQVAIPMMKLTSGKVTYCYDLMDAAYDAAQIWDQSRALGHVPIIDKNPRGKEVVPIAPHEAVSYNERTAAERCNSRLKEEFGARNVMVRGADKVMLHLMFGVLALSADQLLKVAGC